MLEALPLLRVKVTINKVQTSAADNPPGEIGEAGPGVLALCSSTGGTSGKNGSDVIICSRIYQNSRISFMSHLFFSYLEVISLQYNSGVCSIFTPPSPISSYRCFRHHWEKHQDFGRSPATAVGFTILKWSEPCLKWARTYSEMGVHFKRAFLYHYWFLRTCSAAPVKWVHLDLSKRER